MERLEILPIRIRIASIIRKAIYLGEYKSNDKINLSEIAEHLNVSRTPVREALQELESEGLVTLAMNKSATVSNIDKKFIQNILEIRVLLESKAAEKAAVNGMETEELLSRLYRFRDLLEEGKDLDNNEYLYLNQDIHSAIWKAADNTQIESILMRQWSGPNHVGDFISRQRHYEESTKEHIEVLEQIKVGNPAKAAKAMEKHISRSMNNILALYDE